jgi:hypothetical protein
MLGRGEREGRVVLADLSSVATDLLEVFSKLADFYETSVSRSSSIDKHVS